MVLGNNIGETYKEITKIDSENPTLSLSTSKTTNSITVVANATSISGISKYEFSIDGETWVNNDKFNNYTFKNLTYNKEYKLYARATSNVSKTASANTKETTKDIAIPEIEEIKTGVVEITYPDGCGDEFNCTYLRDNGTEVSVTEKTIRLEFEVNGTVVAKVNDGFNYLNSISYTVVVKKDYNFALTGDVQTFTVPKDGYYKVELYGAEGGTADETYSKGGLGGFSSGEIYLEKNDTLYFYVGGKGSVTSGSSNQTSTGGYNGGGNGFNNASNTGRYSGSGGGATDLRVVSGSWNDSDSLKERIMVAGGGGGGWWYSTDWYGAGGNAGGLTGRMGIGKSSGSDVTATGGTQTSSNFGYGTSTTDSTEKPGGGGGYYGGNNNWCTAAGGSSFISGYAGVNAVNSSLSHTNNTLHYSNKYFINTEIDFGVNEGDGTAKITYIGNPTSEDSTKIRNVRYIKDCINGNSVNTYNHWIEIEAINKGVNVAKGKTVTADFTPASNHEALSSIVDGMVDSTNAYTEGAHDTSSCVTVDLGKEYDLEEIAVWHYYGDSRTYKENVTSVAGENKTYREIYSGDTLETSNGNHIKTDTYTPIFKEKRLSGSTNVTITFPSGCTNYTCSYIKDSGEEIIVTESSVTLQFIENGIVSAKVMNGNDYIASSSYTVVYDGSIDSLVPTDNLLYWGQADNPGNTKTLLSDMSGNGNDGILNGFNNTKKSGYSGTDLIFDGTDDYVNLGFANYDFSNAYSQVLYIKINSLKTQSLMANTEYGGFGLEYGEMADYKVNMAHYNSSSYTQAVTDSYINIKNYYTFISVYDGSSLKLYVDGVLSSSESVSTFGGSTLNMFIGANPAGDGVHSDYANMNLKEVMLYDKALTEEDVKTITSGFDSKYEESSFNDKMLSYLNAQDVEGDTWKDQSINNNSGKLYNFNNTETSGKNGNEMYFDGVDDYVNLGLKGHKFEGQMTFAARLNYTDFTNIYTDTIGNWDTGGGGIGISENQKLYFNSYNNKSGYEQPESNEIIVPKQYYNVIGIDNGHEVKLYIDGVLQQTKSYTGTPGDSPAPLFIGGNPTADGTLDMLSAPFALKKFILFDKGIKERDIAKLNKMLYMPEERELEKPTFTVSGNNITINYPEECKTGELTCTYQFDSGTVNNINDSSVTLSLSDFGKVIARVTDGISVKSNIYINQYTITWNASYNGGSVNGGSTLTSTQKYNSSIVLPSYTPTRSEYLFKGWYTSPSGGTKITSSTKFTNQGNVTYYAQYYSAYNTSYGNLAGPSSKYRVVAQTRVTSQNNTGAYLQYRYYVEVTSGNFYSTILTRSYGGTITLNGTGTYGDTGWTNYGWVNYGNSKTFSAEAYYTSSSGAYNYSSASVSITVANAY